MAQSPSPPLPFLFVLPTHPSALPAFGNKDDSTVAALDAISPGLPLRCLDKPTKRGRYQSPPFPRRLLHPILSSPAIPLSHSIFKLLREKRKRRKRKGDEGKSSRAKSRSRLSLPLRILGLKPLRCLKHHTEFFFLSSFSPTPFTANFHSLPRSDAKPIALHIFSVDFSTNLCNFLIFLPSAAFPTNKFRRE